MTARLVAVLVVGLASPAFADSWTWNDGADEIEVRSFYKSTASGLRLPDALAEPLALPSWGALWTRTTRTWAALSLDRRYELQAGWQLGALAATDPAFARGVAVGGSLAQAGAPRARRRLVDFDPVLVERSGLSVSHDLDLLAARLHTSLADLTIGRQVLSWGSGRLWNPTDLLSPFAPTDIDREVRRGVDALRVAIPLASTAQLDLLWLPLPDLRDHGGVVRAQVNARGFDIAPSAAKYVRDIVLGLDVSGDLVGLGVHAEAAWTRALDRDPQGRRDQFVRAVLGAEARPAEHLILGAEYHLDGFGAADPAGYLAVLASDRVRRGEVFGAGRHYLGATASWTYSELLTLGAIAIVNLADPSVLVVPSLEYWAEQHVLVRAGGYLPAGRRPTGALSLRSEYGAAPAGAFGQIAIYWL